MKLEKLLKNLDYKLEQGNINLEISDIIYDSRKIIPNSLFVALKGYNVDGHKYIPDAIEKGANCIVVEEEVNVAENITVIKVDNTRHTLALLSNNYFENPTKHLTTIAITGTFKLLASAIANASLGVSITKIKSGNLFISLIPPN